MTKIRFIDGTTAEVEDHTVIYIGRPRSRDVPAAKFQAAFHPRPISQRGPAFPGEGFFLRVEKNGAAIYRPFTVE